MVKVRKHVKIFISAASLTSFSWFVSVLLLNVTYDTISQANDNFLHKDYGAEKKQIV